MLDTVHEWLGVADAPVLILNLETVGPAPAKAGRADETGFVPGGPSDEATSQPEFRAALPSAVIERSDPLLGGVRDAWSWLPRIARPEWPRVFWLMANLLS